MTTILISILSGVLGAIIGFAIGIYTCAKSAIKTKKITYVIFDSHE